MKNFLLLFPVFLLLGNWSFAQNNVQLHIHHKLATADFALNTPAKNNNIAIHLDGDYTRILEDISLISETIVHGDFELTQQALANMCDFVFSPSAFVNAIPSISKVQHFEIYPNPSNNGTSTLETSSSENNLYNITITNLLGQTVQQINAVTSNEKMELTMATPGIYLVNLIKDGHVVLTEKLIVQ